MGFVCVNCSGHFYCKREFQRILPGSPHTKKRKEKKILLTCLNQYQKMNFFEIEKLQAFGKVFLVGGRPGPHMADRLFSAPIKIFCR